jgi:uncharacterized protein
VKNDQTFLGLVRRAEGAKVHVEISAEIPSASPIIHGRIYRVGQVGSFVRIPPGFLNLYGIVSMVGASETMVGDEPEGRVPVGQRWLEVQLLGESYGMEGFQRGVSVFPTIDDEVHVVTEKDLSVIYGSTGASMIEIGSHVASESLRALIDLDKLVTRHAAIIGSTGSGKSNAVAALLKSLTAGGYPNASVILIDPHGEYGAALRDQARVFSIGDKSNPLQVPYWALSFDELAWFLVDRRSASESQPDIVLRDRIFEQKKTISSRLRAGSVPSEDVTADSPVPFDLRQIWYQSYLHEHATLWEKDNFGKVAYRKDENGNELKGDAASVVAPVFEPPAPGSAAPFKSQRGVGLASYLTKIQGRLKDRRFDFILKQGEFDGVTLDLHDLLARWLGHEKAITVLDLGGVPSEILDLTVGVVTRIVFETMFWGRDLSGLGRSRPILLVYEEAHGYLPRGESSQFVAGYARKSVRRVLKEGRKYGLGAILVSQRPSELDETIVSQCGTFFALRLSNSDDQARVRSVVTETMYGLTSLLPALRTGEAVIVGEAVQIPSRVRFPLVEPRPKSNDPEPTKCWREERVQASPYAGAVTGWRTQRSAQDKTPKE